MAASPVVTCGVDLCQISFKRAKVGFVCFKFALHMYLQSSSKEHFCLKKKPTNRFVSFNPHYLYTHLTFAPKEAAI